MLKTPDWAAGAKYLREHAPELIPLIDRFPVCELKPEPKEKYFGTLVTGIVSQQLPPDVSLQLLEKLGKFLGNPLQPQAVVEVSIEALCEQGLVKQKAEYLKSFAEAAVAGQVTIEKFSEMTDAEITKQLVQIRGLGQWTIEMFLLLALCRTDVVPSADFIFKKVLNLNAQRQHLQQISQTLQQAVISKGFDCPSTSHIVPVIIGESTKTVEKAKAFHIQPKNFNQELMLKSMRENIITVATGSAGVGKSLLMCYYAASELLAGNIRKIVITRHIIIKESSHKRWLFFYFYM